MLEFITIPLVVGICVAGTYGLFELFARRKERLTLIEKMSDKMDRVPFDGKLGLPSYFKGISFSALKIGFLMAGIGLGILIGFFLNIAFSEAIRNGNWNNREMYSAVYGASVLLCGGIGLIIAFLIEMKMNKKKD